MIKVSIDRIRIIVPVQDKSIYSNLCSLMNGMKGDKGYKFWKSKSATGASIPIGSHQTMGIQVGFSHHKLYAGVDFKPAFLNDETWEEIENHLSYMFPDGYDTVLKYGSVSYFEIAVDAVGTPPDNLLVFDKRLKVSNLFFPLAGGVPTQYLGPKGGNRVITLYDRAALLNKKNSQHSSMPITRIETRLRRLKCSIPELLFCKNPFVGVGVCRVQDAHLASPAQAWKAFIEQCRVSGTAVALGTIDGPMRAKYLALLQGVICTWWDTTAIWQGYPAVLTTVPGVFSESKLQLIANPSEIDVGEPTTALH